MIAVIAVPIVHALRTAPRAALLCLCLAGCATTPLTSPGTFPMPDEATTEPTPGHPAWTTTVSSLVDALYATVSFGPGEEPDWPRAREMFLRGAVIIQPYPPETGPVILDIDGFVEDFRQFIANSRAGTEGFRERIAAKRIEEFGNIASAAVVFEPGYGDEEPAGRGVDMIQLVRHDGRWWITSILTQFEREDTPMPALFLESDPG